MTAARGIEVLPGGGGWLRIMLGVTGLLTMLELWVPDQRGAPVVLQLVLMGGVWLWLVMRPGSAAAAVLLFGALCLRVGLGHPQLDGSLIALVLLLPLVHQLSALSAVVPLRANVHLRALLATIARYLGAVLATVAGLITSRLLGWW